MKTASRIHPASRQAGFSEPPAFFVAGRFKDAFTELGLTSLDAVFAFDSWRDLAKSNIGRFRRRASFDVTPSDSGRPVKVFLKRYEQPPVLRQVLNWVCHHRRSSFASAERRAIEQLAKAGVNVPRVVACGEQWGALFEQRSFLITEEIADSQSLERRLPECFDSTAPVTLQARRVFIRRLAEFVRRFHTTGYRHRDLYLSHIFCSDAGKFCLIDLARASRPFLQRRFQVKDIAQLHYSSPAARFSRTDRLRFYLTYAGRRRLVPRDKAFLREVAGKTARMVRHNVTHGAVPPFLEGARGGL